MTNLGMQVSSKALAVLVEVIHLEEQAVLEIYLEIFLVVEMRDQIIEVPISAMI